MSLKLINVKLDEFFDYILENILKKIAHLKCGPNIRIRNSIERSTIPIIAVNHFTASSTVVFILHI